jgi:hypothetical protein
MIAPSMDLLGQNGQGADDAGNGGGDAHEDSMFAQFDEKVRCMASSDLVFVIAAAFLYPHDAPASIYCWAMAATA